jgi:uncharacterized protein (UPF0216 family)
MPRRNAVVSTIARFEPVLERPAAEVLRDERALTVELEDGRQVRLEADDPRATGFAQILEGLSRLRLPVYLELDPETETIDRLLIPHVTRVVGVRQIDEGVLDVELESSHARHVLRPSVPDFDELATLLNEAVRARSPAVVTETDQHEIIDVRPYTPSPEAAPLPFPFPEPKAPWWSKLWRWLVAKLWLSPWSPLSWSACVSPAKAEQAFYVVNATSCDPLTVPPGCIPFLYPDDGCWARAHEMCRLMIKHLGLRPNKVWIYGDLHVDTKNNPICSVSWRWHVAPTLCVRYRRYGWLLGERKMMVIDPSLFFGPVDEATWQGVQGDPNAQLERSGAHVYWTARVYAYQEDPTYERTEQNLARYRLDLLNRSISFGPPPYVNCPQFPIVVDRIGG